MLEAKDAAQTGDRATHGQQEDQVSFENLQTLQFQQCLFNATSCPCGIREVHGTDSCEDTGVCARGANRGQTLSQRDLAADSRREVLKYS